MRKGKGPDRGSLGLAAQSSRLPAAALVSDAILLNGVHRSTRMWVLVLSAGKILPGGSRFHEGDLATVFLS